MLQPMHRPFWQRPLGLTAILLLLGFAARQAHLLPSALAQGWEGDIRAMENYDKAHPPKPGSIVFTGSSSFTFWSSLGDMMKPLPVLNHAFGGSEYSDLNDYVDRIIIAYHPPAVVVYSGDNDLASPGGNTPESVVGQVRRLVTAIHAKLPDTWIYILSVKPSYARWDAWPRMKQANVLLQDFIRTQDRVEYIDVATPMFGGQAKPPRDLFVIDGLHPSAKCYALWTSIIKPVLMKRFGPGATSQLDFAPDGALALAAN